MNLFKSGININLDSRMKLLDFGRSKVIVDLSGDETSQQLFDGLPQKFLFMVPKV